MIEMIKAELDKHFPKDGTMKMAIIRGIAAIFAVIVGAGAFVYGYARALRAVVVYWITGVNIEDKG